MYKFDTQNIYPYLECRIKLGVRPARVVRRKGAVLALSRTYTFQMGVGDSTEKKQRGKELHYIYFSPNIIRMITSREGWVGHAARMRQKRKHTRFS